MRALWIFALASLAGCTLLLNTDAPTCDGFGGTPTVECAVGTCNASTHQCEGGNGGSGSSGSTGRGDVLLTAKQNRVIGGSVASSPLEVGSGFASVKAGALDASGAISGFGAVSTEPSGADLKVTGVPQGRYVLEFTANPSGNAPQEVILVESSSRTVDLSQNALGRDLAPTVHDLGYDVDVPANIPAAVVAVLDPDAPARFDLPSGVLQGMPNGTAPITPAFEPQAGDPVAVVAITGNLTSTDIQIGTASGLATTTLQAGTTLSVDAGVKALDGGSLALGAVDLRPIISGLTTTGATLVDARTSWFETSVPMIGAAMSLSGFAGYRDFSDCSGDAPMDGGFLDWGSVPCQPLFSGSRWVVSTSTLNGTIGGNPFGVGISSVLAPDASPGPLAIPAAPLPANVAVNGQFPGFAGSVPVSDSSDVTISWSPLSGATRYLVMGVQSPLFIYMDAQRIGPTESVTIPAELLAALFQTTQTMQLELTTVFDAPGANVAGQLLEAQPPVVLVTSPLVTLSHTSG